MNDSTHCLMETRRAAVRARHRNGLDYVETGDPGGHAGGGAADQHYLTVYFLGRLQTKSSDKDRHHHDHDQDAREWRISPAHFKISGGRRITNIRVLQAWVFRPAAEDEDDVVVLRVEETGGETAGVGDFSCYTLEIVDAPEGSPPAVESAKKEKCRRCHHDHDESLTDLRAKCDQRYLSVTFGFKVNCPSTLDCAPARVCTEPRTPPPAINYLAKDYFGFRELILDRLSLTLPEWNERHTPDVGIAVTEVMAYEADHLSYYQDAVAQEAYLDTARRRISVRRHARLVDYILHEGCNARAWVCCTPEGPATLFPREFDVRTKAPDENAKALIFEPVRRLRNQLLERGDFFDLRRLAWRIQHGGAADLRPRLSRCLLRDLRRHQERDVEAALPEELAARLIVELNERVLLDQTYAATGAPAGDPEEIARLNRVAFDNIHALDCVARDGLYLHPAHETIHIYTWQNRDCCLEAGATECVLVDDIVRAPEGEEGGDASDPDQDDKKKSAGGDDTGPAPQEECPSPRHPEKPGGPKARLLRLRPGDVIIFEEVIGPQTGNPADADKSRRHAVRLTHVVPEWDSLLEPPQAVLRVRWAPADALPFSFCLSRLGPPKDCLWLDRISVVRGNVILVDHGETRENEPLGDVEREDLDYHCRCAGVLDEISVRSRPFRPNLDEPDLTFAVPLQTPGPAALTLEQKPWQAVPSLAVESLPPAQDGAGPSLSWTEFDAGEASDGNPLPEARQGVWNLLSASAQTAWRNKDRGPEDKAVAEKGLMESLAKARREWSSVVDLLGSEAGDRHFVVEMDDNRRGHLRFGRDGLGLTPEAGESFRCDYRTGNGPAGNTGLETIVVFHAKEGVLGSFKVRNPLPARGGSVPESLADAKRNAPFVFRLRQRRAVTAADYAQLAQKNPRVQRAGAELRWTGSRQSVRVAIDPLGMSDAPADLLTAVRDELLHYRRIGHNLEIIPALYVPVALKLDICAQPWALRGDVEAAVRDALTSGLSRDGAQGFFHPDRLTFGEPVRISPLIAAVQKLPGVMSVRITGLQRWGGHPCRELADGFLTVGPLEVARLDNDPDFPEHGGFTLNIKGGR